MKPIFKLWLAGALASAMVLSAGCSGSSDDDVGVGNGNGNGNGNGSGNPGSADSATVPDSAGATVAGFLAYLLTLSPNDETSEPLLIKDSFAVPVDETSESQPLS